MKIYSFLVLLSVLSTSVHALEAPMAPPPRIDAAAHVLMDYHSGDLLAEGNPDQRLEPASLTKIMTMYALAHELKEGNVALEDPVTISEQAWRTGGSKMFIEVGKQVSVRDLLMGVVIQSGNDASVALAEHISGSEEVFAELMNQHARRIGLKNTHFTNTSGLPDPNHYTTARDLALLSRALVRDYPDVYALAKIKEFTFNGIKQPNRNKLLWRDASVDGLKTGHTQGAGYCLVASALRDGMRLISVVLGSKTEKARGAATQGLLNYGFRFYETHRLYAAHQAIAQVRVWKGETQAADVGLAEDLFITLPRRRHKDLKATIHLEPRIVAPVAKGQRGGTLKINLRGKALMQRPLVLLKSIAEGPLYNRLVDEVWMLIQ
ncbi:MAG: D-alanyl-D-alanine carboxypeptidase family protein [Gammaproteobacteria bacterium]